MREFPKHLSFEHLRRRPVKRRYFRYSGKNIFRPPTASISYVACRWMMEVDVSQCFLYFYIRHQTAITQNIPNISVYCTATQSMPSKIIREKYFLALDVEITLSDT